MTNYEFLRSLPLEWFSCIMMCPYEIVMPPAESRLCTGDKRCEGYRDCNECCIAWLEKECLIPEGTPFEKMACKRLTK